MKNLKKFGLIIMILVMLFGITGCFEEDEVYQFTIESESGTGDIASMKFFEGVIYLWDFNTETPLHTATFWDNEKYEVLFDLEEGSYYTILITYDNDFSADLSSGDIYYSRSIYLTKNNNFIILDSDWVTR